MFGRFLLAAAVAVAVTPASAASFADALGFNAVIFNDLSAGGGDTEGRLAVGGNMTLTAGSYSVAGCSSPGCSIVVAPAGSQPQSGGTRDDLVVGGNVSATAGTVSWAMTSGNARVGGSVTDVNISFLDANQLFQGVGAGAVGVDFAAAEVALTQASADLAMQVANGTISVDTGFELTLVGTDVSLNVFEVTAAQWGGSAKTRYIDVPLGSRVLINVTGTTVTVDSGQMNFGVSGCLDPIFMISPACGAIPDFAPNTVVNFIDATSIVMNNFDHLGAMLAPLASLDVSGGSVNGQAVLAGVTTASGFEFHLRSDNGTSFDDLLDSGNPPVSTVPLPAGGLLLLTALGAIGLVRRRAA